MKNIRDKSYYIYYIIKFRLKFKKNGLISIIFGILRPHTPQRKGSLGWGGGGGGGVHYSYLLL